MRAKNVRFWLACLALLLAACTATPPGLAPPTQGAPGYATLPSTATAFQPLPAGTQDVIAPFRNTATAANPVPPATSTPTLAASASPLPVLSEPTLTPTTDPNLNPARLPLPPTACGLTRSCPPGCSSKSACRPGLACWQRPMAPRCACKPGAPDPVSQWIYALAAPFPTIPDGVSSETLRRCWRGEAAGPFGEKPLLLDASALAGLSVLWGAPASSAVQVLPAGELLEAAWNSRPAWAIVPFEALEPAWKVLEVDGQSPLRKNFDPASYPLAVPISLQGEAALVERFGAAGGESLLPVSNRDPGKLTVLAMTGVTALVRATAFAMERQGITYPAKDIGGLLSAADLTHISNEVPFAEDCPFPDPLQQGMRFCSDPKYIKLLETVGTDIVELTGDHFQDWGVQAMRFTLELYKEEGWPYYGGGGDLEEARQPLLVEHNGNRLAFLGCNAKGGSFAQAGKDHPGAYECGDEWVQQQAQALRSQGYLPVVTFQHFEYYDYHAQPDQKLDFRGMAEAGALIVSGSQAHQPQAFEFSDGALIHYGLGNLFFDQYDVSAATRQGFIDQHIFYDGRYLGTELVTIVFVDYARPRLMTPEERQELLQAVFNASGW